jgi:hypothetical protein
VSDEELAYVLSGVKGQIEKGAVLSGLVCVSVYQP